MKRGKLEFLIISIMVCLLIPVTASAAVTSIDAVAFTINADKDAGLGGDVKITFTKSGSNYSGTLYLPGSADTSKLTLSWEDGISVKVNGASYTSGTAPIPAKDNSMVYTVTVGRNTANFTVKTLQGSADVEGMFLVIDESLGTISAMNGDRNHETSCYGVLSFDNEIYDMSMKGRGNWTWGVPEANNNPSKKPYNITIYKSENPDKGIERFDKKDSVKLIEGVKAKKWSILANYGDGTLLRNKIGYDLATKLGIGLESRFVDIWINGKYNGNYLMTPKSDYNAPDGGYMLELDNNIDREDPYFALNGLKAAGTSENVITVKAVGDDAEEAGLETKDIQDWMQTMLDAVMDASSDEYLQYIDIDSWAKFYLVEEFCKNHDIMCGSILMHRDGLTDRDKLIAGPIWDLDNSFGRTVANSKINVSNADQFSPNNWYIDSVNGVTAFLQYLGKHKDFMERVYEIYNENQDAFNDTLTDLNTQAAFISDSATMNFSVWNINQSEYNITRVTRESTLGTGKYAYKEIVTNDYDDYLTNLRSFVTNRLAFFSDNLSVSVPEDGIIAGDMTYKVCENISLIADCTADAYQWQSSFDGETWTDIAGANAKTYTAAALCTMNDMQIRCVVKNVGNIINTSRVAKVAPSATAILEPVTLTVTMDGHKHEYNAVVVAPTCTGFGYTSHVCACGFSYNDSYRTAWGHNFVDNACTRCGAVDPAYIPDCFSKKTVSLKAGKLFLTLGGHEFDDEYIFAQSGNGWTIRDKSNRYLTLSNNALSYANTAFVWTFSNNRFSASSSSSNPGSYPWGGGSWGWGNTTYYLTYSTNQLTVSTNTTGATASFAEAIESEEHSFGEKWIPTANEQHYRVCITCGGKEYGNCVYDQEGNKCICGRDNPHNAYVEEGGDLFEEAFIRIFHLDAGRKYFSVNQIKSIIDMLAQNHYTHLELALGNDALRFLLDDMSIIVSGVQYTSDSITAGISAGNKAYYNDPNGNYLTEQEMDSIIEYAKEKNVGLIPLINTPGHMDAILNAMKSVGLTQAAYNASARTVDVTQKEAVNFTLALVDKYIQYFAEKGVEIFNMGCDEYANDKYSSGSMGFGNLISSGEYGSFISFVNSMAAQIKDAGMVPMAFNDGIYFNDNKSFGTFDTDILIAYWTSGWTNYNVRSAAKLTSDGFKIINTNDGWYYVLGRASGGYSL